MLADGLSSTLPGMWARYVAPTGLLVETWPENWHRSRVFRVLSLGGYIAFDLAKTVTGFGERWTRVLGQWVKWGLLR